jgi:YbbR domain-containing protein
MVERSQTEPETITLTGLKTELARIKEVLTEPIDVTGLSTSKNIEANVSRIGLVDAELSTQRVTVKLSIGEQKINKRFPSVPVEVTGSEYVSAIKPQQVEIIIQGTPGVLERVKNSDLRAFVEVRELAPGRYEREIKVKIPPETTLIETIPANAAVEIYNQKRLN